MHGQRQAIRSMTLQEIDTEIGTFFSGLTVETMSSTDATRLRKLQAVQREGEEGSVTTSGLD